MKKSDTDVQTEEVDALEKKYAALREMLASFPELVIRKAEHYPSSWKDEYAFIGVELLAQPIEGWTVCYDIFNRDLVAQDNGNQVVVVSGSLADLIARIVEKEATHDSDEDQ